jgi:hypothetical protein
MGSQSTPWAANASRTPESRRSSLSDLRSGIDARILVKITKPESWLTPIQVQRLSGSMCSAIGHDNFYIRINDRDFGRPRHAISLVLDDNAEYPDEFEEIIGRPFNPKGPALFMGHDADPIQARSNEQLLEVHTTQRIFIEDYARGDWKVLMFTLMWLQYNIKDSIIYYGGDSSGCEVERITQQRLMELTQYYLTNGQDYYNYNHSKNAQALCDFCQIPSVCYNVGNPTITSHGCNGCGQNWWLKMVGPNQFLVTRWGDLPEETRYNYQQLNNDVDNQIKLNKRKMYPFDGIFRAQYPYVAAPAQIAAGVLQIESGTA